MKRRRITPEPIAAPSRALYYRSHAHYIAHLAIMISEISEAQLRGAREATAGDLSRASSDDVAQAKAMLERAGVRMIDDSPPAWHFGKAAFTRGAYD